MPAVIKNGEVVDISNYVKADDLQGRDVTVTIEKVQSEKLTLPGKRPDDCAVIYFVGKSKPLILNTTNLRSLRDMFGKKVADWHGKQCTLYPTMTKLRGQPKPCIRIREQATTTGLTEADKEAIRQQEAQEANQ